MSEPTELIRLTDEIRGMRRDLTKIGNQQAASETNHKWLGKQLDTHSSRLNRHSDRIDLLESSSSSAETTNRVHEWAVRLLIGALMSGSLLILVEVIKKGIGS
jgi:DNA anti-recombination protein RmuC